MEVQPTDFENASFAVFITLLSHAILQLGVNLYVPISKVDENMSRAQKRDAVKGGRFWFRKHVWPKSYGTRGVGYARSSELDSIEEEFKQMTMDEIINGKESFPGFLGIVNAYLDSLKIESDAKLKLNKYLNLIKRRANGSLQTPAAWIRDFVRAHPAYKFDSVISQQINYDIIKAIEES
ncbi:Glutamate--cysteine ligase catalytic subunit [Ceratobasidium theobromae]|uniref:Glutamate--cysteine ligase n=1 Tax=Ceratobasidium theobromae TaxID=1582974 RepID=A0A5N5QGA9_9AGAM|nr:Glutamate--cysteine ligase catalytic subunit [Ceratobasidium theobromae]